MPCTAPGLAPEASLLDDDHEGQIQGRDRSPFNARCAGASATPEAACRPHRASVRRPPEAASAPAVNGASLARSEETRSEENRPSSDGAGGRRKRKGERRQASPRGNNPAQRSGGAFFKERVKRIPVDSGRAWDHILVRGVRAPGEEPVRGLRERSTDRVELGPFFIPLHQPDSPNRAGRLST